MANLNPIGDNLLLQLIEEKISETIIIPDSIKENRDQTVARVVGVGPRVKANILVGDIVLGNKYADQVHGPVKDLGDNLFIAPESEILAILESEPGDDYDY